MQVGQITLVSGVNRFQLVDNIIDADLPYCGPDNEKPSLGFHLLESDIPCGKFPDCPFNEDDNPGPKLDFEFWANKVLSDVARPSLEAWHENMLSQGRCHVHGTQINCFCRD